MRSSTSAVALGCIGWLSCAIAGGDTGWPTYLGPADNTHYSALAQIDRSNVAQLQVAWTYDIGDAGARFECSPLVVGRTLYGMTPSLQVVALDAATGVRRWSFDSGVRGGGPVRGVSYWRSGHSERLFAGIMNYLYALDPMTGRVVTSFGDGGRIDLRRGLRGDYRRHFVAMTSPGAIFENLIIVGFRTVESRDGAPGDIRAFDVRTGKLVWQFHTVPHPGEYGHDTWPKDAWRDASGANSWAGMAIDEARGIVFVPTGSAGPDFLGDRRTGDNLFANTLLALDARSGRRLWHFQGVHHDLWDRDFPSPPTLVTVARDGLKRAGVALASKQGYLFVLDRETGEPLFPIEEAPYPASTVPGEVTSRTQPKVVRPAPFARQILTEDLITRRSPEARRRALEEFRTMISGGPFVPLSLGAQTVVFPGFDGGAEWGGAGFDPGTHVLYINSNDLAWTGGLEEVAQARDPSEALYQQRCLACHGSDRKGTPPTVPALVDILARKKLADIEATVRLGRGQMPAFDDIRGEQLEMLARYVSAGRQEEKESTPVDSEMRAPTNSRKQDGRYEFTGYRRFLDFEGYPAVEPPWGTLNAIDLNTGEYLWRVPLGEYPELAARGVPTTGTENYGGPLVTAGGLLFIGATIYDRQLRAIDRTTGRTLWQYTLPHSGTATPITYSVDRRQFVLIATSGARNPKATQGSAFVAFSLALPAP